MARSLQRRWSPLVWCAAPSSRSRSLAAVSCPDKIEIQAHAISEGAREQIEKAGGTVTILDRTDRWVTARPRNRKLPIDRELKAARLGKVGGPQKRSDVTGAE